MVASSRMVGRRAAQDIFSRDITTMMTRLYTRQTIMTTTTGRSAFSTTSAVLSETRTIRRNKERTTTPTLSSSQAGTGGMISSSKIPVFLPGTFVLPLISKLPREPSVLFPFLREWVKTKTSELGAILAAKFGSKPKFFARAVFKLNNKTVVATAKALHRSMSEALASGDKETLRKVCGDRMADTLVATVDARPPGKRYAWELVKYTKSWRYPRIMSQKIAKLEQSKNAPMIRQVVVRICSRQRRTELDAKGEVVPGSLREANLVENIALTTIIHPLTWKQDEWRITGTFKDTSPESWAVEQALLKEVEKLDVAKHI